MAEDLLSIDIHVERDENGMEFKQLIQWYLLSLHVNRPCQFNTFWAKEWHIKILAILL